MGVVHDLLFWLQGEENGEESWWGIRKRSCKMIHGRMELGDNLLGNTDEFVFM